MRKNVMYLCVFCLVAVNLLLLHLFLRTVCKPYDAVVEHLFNQPQIKIFVTYHKPSYLPKRGKIVQPIQVGRAIERESFMGGKLSAEDVFWLHENMIGDDSGDNISSKNRTFDVLTAYYWVWKHYREVGNPQYIGFMAHRKQLVFGSFNPEEPDYGYQSDELLKILKRHKIIFAPMAIAYENNPLPISLYEAYNINHNIADFDAMLRIIKQKYPELYKVAEDIIFDDKHLYAAWNFWIVEKSLAFDYFEKLFDVMFELEKNIGSEVDKRDFYQRRAFGFLAERFFAIWLEFEKRNSHIVPYKAKHFVRD